MTVDLTDRISSARRSTYAGAGFRQLAPQYDALSGEGARIHGGRFNPPDSFPVLYLCSTAGCAAAEYMRFADRHPMGASAFLPRLLYRYDAEFTSVLDLTEAATLAHLEITTEQLIDDDRALPHHIGEVAHQFGYQAILNASATGVDAVLAVFTESLRTGRLGFALESTWETVADIPVL